MRIAITSKDRVSIDAYAQTAEGPRCSDFTLQPAAHSSNRMTVGIVCGHNAGRATYLDDQAPRLGPLLRQGRAHQLRGVRFLRHRRSRATAESRRQDHPP